MRILPNVSTSIFLTVFRPIPEIAELLTAAAVTFDKTVRLRGKATDQAAEKMLPRVPREGGQRGTLAFDFEKPAFVDQENLARIEIAQTTDERGAFVFANHPAVRNDQGLKLTRVDKPLHGFAPVATRRAKLCFVQANGSHENLHGASNRVGLTCRILTFGEFAAEAPARCFAA